MKNKKAVSPVIATLLLILIAVAAAILVYVWVTGYTSSAMKQGAPELEEKIKVEAVNVNVTSTYGNLTIYVRNIGSTQANVTDIYIIDAKSNEIVAHCVVKKDDTKGGGVLNPRDIGAFYVNATEAYAQYDSSLGVWKSVSSASGAQALTTSIIQAGRTYMVKVATMNGVEASLSFTYRP